MPKITEIHERVIRLEERVSLILDMLKDLTRGLLGRASGGDGGQGGGPPPGGGSTGGTPQDPYSLSFKLFQTLENLGPILLGTVIVFFMVAAGVYVMSLGLEQNQSIQNAVNTSVENVVNLSNKLTKRLSEQLDLEDNANKRRRMAEDALTEAQLKAKEQERLAKASEKRAKDAKAEAESALEQAVATRKDLVEKTKELVTAQSTLEVRTVELEGRKKSLGDLQSRLSKTDARLSRSQTEVNAKSKQLLALRDSLDNKQRLLDARELTLGERDKQLKSAEAQARKSREQSARQIVRLKEQRDFLLESRKELLAQIESARTQLAQAQKEGEITPEPTAIKAPEDEAKRKIDKIASDARRDTPQILADYLRALETRDIDDANRIVQTLVGTSTQEFRNAIESAAGFDLWYKVIILDQPENKEMMFVGIRQQNADELRGLLSIVADQNEIVGVEMKTGPIIFVRLPNQSNWLQTWTVSITVGDDRELDDDYVKSDKPSLTVSEFVELMDEGFEFKPIVGQEIGLKVHAIDEFREKYREVYDLWRQQKDFRNRPIGNIDMLERRKNLSIMALADQISFEEAVGLKDNFSALVKAAVDRNTGSASDYLGPDLPGDIVGTIGAIVLQDRFKLRSLIVVSTDEVGYSPAVALDTEPAQADAGDVGRMIATVAAEYRDFLRNRRKVDVSFIFAKSKNATNWVLRDLSKEVLIKD